MTDDALALRQPQDGDIVGAALTVAGVGTAFEGSWGWRLVGGGRTLAEGMFTGGSSGVMSPFAATLPVPDHGYHGPASVEVWADDPSGAEPRRTGVPVVAISGASGYRPVRVQAGDTLTAIAERHGSSVDRIVVASFISDPHQIEIDQLVRVPV